MKRLKISIRARLILLTILSTLPALFIILYNSILHRKAEIKSETVSLLETVESLSNIQETITLSTKQMLMTLSQFPEVKNKNVEACNNLFRDVLDNTPFHNSIALADIDGNVFSSALPFKPFNISERKNFKEVLKTGEFSSGEYIISKIFNAPAISFAYPVFANDKKINAVIVTGFKLDRYEKFLSQFNLPKDFVLSISDHKGIILYSIPALYNGTKIIGKKVREEHWTNVNGEFEKGTYYAKGIDGNRRIYAFKRLRLKEDEKPYIYIRLGVPENYILSNPEKELKINILMLGIAFVLALIGAWIIGDISIVNRLKRLVNAVKQIGEGNFNVRTGLNYDRGGEIGFLAQSVDIMAEALKKREDDREYAEREKHKLENQIRQSQKMEAIGKLAGGIAHDFNNILSPILGWTELALSNITEENVLKEPLETILKSTHRAKDLVKQILALSRQSEQEAIPVQVSIIIKEIVKFMRASLPSNIEIKEQISKKAYSSKTIADPTQIHQILLNLCINAAYAMREKGGLLEISLSETNLDADFTAKHAISNQPQVFLDSRFRGNDVIPTEVGIHVAGKLMDGYLETGEYLHLTVSDTGHGMDENVKSHIFEPYFTTKPIGEGTGIGLSLVYGIVKNCGGLITVDSEQNKGSVFNIFLPKSSAKDISENNNVEPIPTGEGTILIVDDEIYIIEMEQSILELLGYEVFSSIDSQEALKAFLSAPDKFDLVITDQTMPKMSGFELSKEILKIRPDIPIILCTGFSEAMSEEKAKSIGIREYLTKPIFMKELAEAIKRQLN
ncbi:MAG: response regulator [Desulfobacterales bacterium]|nr:response regulator [Desulfobacterales bacterium]